MKVGMHKFNSCMWWFRHSCYTDFTLQEICLPSDFELKIRQHPLYDILYSVLDYRITSGIQTEVKDSIREMLKNPEK